MKPTTLLIGFVTLTAGGLAAVRLSGDASTKTVSFPHDKVIETYTSAVQKSLLEQPTDGRFGSNRAPSIHLVFAHQVEGYQEIKDLTKDYRVYSLIESREKKEPKKPDHIGGDTGKMVDLLTKLPPDFLKDPNVRATCFMRLYDEADWFNPTMTGLAFDRSVKPTDTKVRKEGLKVLAADVGRLVVQLSNKLDHKDYETYSDKVTVNGKDGWVLIKSITPKEKSCYNCHSDIKYGKPIGHVMTFLIKKK
ncbi:MAG: hypothetical protein JST12_12780 [Armatimonadetes bacterium]|nr:hypothetical protein [Armatimonadota bacterium]